MQVHHVRRNLNDDTSLSILQVRGTGLMGDHDGGVHEGDECKWNRRGYLNEEGVLEQGKLNTLLPQPPSWGDFPDRVTHQNYRQTGNYSV